MNRRSFLGSLIGGVAASAAVRTWPFRVFSFPAEIVPATLPATGLRFIQAFDPHQGRMISRLDALYGFGIRLDIPKTVEAGYSIASRNGKPLPVEVLHDFALRHTQGKFPVELLTERVLDKGDPCIQMGWDIINHEPGFTCEAPSKS